MENEQLKKDNINLKNKYENLLLSQRKNNISINNNIIKNTQESIKLNFNDEINLPLSLNYKNKLNNNSDNIELKKVKLKYLLKSKIFKMKEYLHKYFLSYYYNTILLKYLEKKPSRYTKNIIKSSSNNIINNINNIKNSNDYSFSEKNEKIKKKK